MKKHLAALSNNPSQNVMPANFKFALLPFCFSPVHSQLGGKSFNGVMRLCYGKFE